MEDWDDFEDYMDDETKEGYFIIAFDLQYKLDYHCHQFRVFIGFY